MQNTPYHTTNTPFCMKKTCETAAGQAEKPPPSLYFGKKEMRFFQNKTDTGRGENLQDGGEGVHIPEMFFGADGLTEQAEHAAARA